MTLDALRNDLRDRACPAHAAALGRYFKTGPGEYGEGDRFLGVRVPEIRKLVRRCPDLPAPDVRRVLHSAIHEERLLALFLLVGRFSKGEEAERKRVYELYLASTRYVNNWDLVDASAGRIVGAYLWKRSRAPIRRLARSRNLWERRIAVMATSYFVQQGDFEETLRIARMLLRDEEDLVHKAVGWMLREVGNRDREAEEGFLREHYRDMPRTMLRYAIEKFPERRRRRYLKGKV